MTTVTETTEPEQTTTTEPEQPLAKGDLDGDGVPTLDDAMTILVTAVRALAGLDSGLTDAQYAAADVDGDGEVTMSDAQIVLVYYVSVYLAHLPFTMEDIVRIYRR